MGPLRRGQIDRLLNTYWFLPSLITVAAICLAILLTWLDRVTPQLPPWLAWAYGGGPDGARTLLSAVAGSIITVVSVTFSVLVVALTVSSQHFGPRLLRTFMRDRPAQVVLGTFMGTFTYCLIVLRSVQSSGETFSLFVPNLGVAGAIVLTLVSVGGLIYYVHHVAMSMQVAELMKRLALELEETIDRLYPAPIGDDPDPPHDRPPPVRESAHAVTAEASGYVQYVDTDLLLRVASRHDAVVWLTAQPGDFVVNGDVVAFVHASSSDDRVDEALRSIYTIDVERTPQQDPAFAVQQLVEVALRALSPGTNEPFTAVTAIDRLSQGLAKLASRRIPSAVRVDESGRPRVVAKSRTFAELLQDGFEPIALHAGRTPEVAVRLLERLRGLAAMVRRNEDQAAVERTAARIFEMTTQQLRDERHRDALRGLVDDVGKVVRNSRKRPALSIRR